MISLLRNNKPNIQYVVFEATQRCNLNCSYCYNHWKGNFKDQKLSPENYNHLKNTISKLFKSANINHITFSGGEPLLVERLKELSLFCRFKRASVSVITNGNAGTEDDIQQLLSIGVKLFELPFHSFSPDIHDEMTGVKGSWSKAKTRMTFIRDAGGMVVPVIVITKYNFQTIPDTLSCLNEMGFKRIMLNRYNIGGINTNSPLNVLPSKDELNFAFYQASETGKKLNLDLSSNVCTPHCILNPSDYKNIRFSNCSADINKRPLTITATGDLRFCNHSPVVLGNIFTDTIENILAKGQQSNDCLTIPSFCNNCNLYDKCLGGCRAAAQQAGKTFHDVDPITEYMKHEFTCYT